MSLPTKATIVSRCGKARCLSFGNVQTPVVMIQTRTCFQPYLTLGSFFFVFFYRIDMLKKLPEKPLFSITAGELYDYPLYLIE